MARDSRNASRKDLLEDELYMKNKQIWESDQRIRKMQSQMRFTTGKAPPGLLLDKSGDIDSFMNFLEAELDSILHGHDAATTALLLPTQVQSNDLAQLIRSVSGFAEEEATEGERLRGWILKFEPEIVIRTLTLAALREWIFNTPFPQFAGNASHLVQAYREAIMVQGLNFCSRAWSCFKTNFLLRWLAKPPKSRIDSLWFAHRVWDVPTGRTSQAGGRASVTSVRDAWCPIFKSS